MKLTLTAGCWIKYFTNLTKCDKPLKLQQSVVGPGVLMKVSVQEHRDINN